MRPPPAEVSHEAREAFIRGVSVTPEERRAGVAGTPAERPVDVSQTSAKRPRDASRTPGASILSERKRGPARARMTVYLSAATRAELESYCQRTGEEYSDVVDAAVRGHLARLSGRVTRT